MYLSKAQKIHDVAANRKARFVSEPLFDGDYWQLSFSLLIILVLARTRIWIICTHFTVCFSCSFDFFFSRGSSVIGRGEEKPWERGWGVYAY